MGFHVGGRTPTGYLVEKTGPARSPKSVLVPDPEFASVVQRMAKECLAGKGARAIAVGLNDDGLRTKRGKLWSTACTTPSRPSGRTDGTTPRGGTIRPGTIPDPAAQNDETPISSIFLSLISISGVVFFFSLVLFIQSLQLDVIGWG